jgi:hypothetical protein
MQCPARLLAHSTDSHSKSVEVCRTPNGTTNCGSPNTMDERIGVPGTGLGTPIASSPTLLATVRESYMHMDSHLTVPGPG